MAAIAFTESALQNVKRGLRGAFLDSKSSHLSEALAVALGFRTHAALLAKLERQETSDPEFMLLDDEVFIRRLLELEGGGEPTEEDLDWFESISYPSEAEVIKTKSRAFHEKSYTSPRARAWRNIMVATVNAGIEQGLFTIRPGDNRWPDDPHMRKTKVFRFTLDGIPAIGSVSDAGFDELNIHGTLWPTPEGERWTAVVNAGFLAGEGVATGWLERRDGAWIQYNDAPQLRCRKNRLATVAALTVIPKCFGDRGDFKM